MKYVGKVVNFGLYQALTGNTFQGIIPTALSNTRLGLLGAGITGLSVGYSLDRFRTDVTDDKTSAAASDKLGKSIRYVGKDPAHLLGKSIDVSSKEGKELFDAESKYEDASAKAYAKNQSFLIPLIATGISIGASGLLNKQLSKRIVNSSRIS